MAAVNPATGSEEKGYSIFEPLVPAVKEEARENTAGPLTTYTINSWTSARRDWNLASSTRAAGVLSRLNFEYSCIGMSMKDAGNPIRSDISFSFMNQLGPDTFMYAGMKSERIEVGQREFCYLEESANQWNLGMILAAETWKDYTLMVTSTKGLVVVESKTLTVLMTISNFQVWIYYLRYKYHNTGRNLCQIGEGAFFVVDDYQNLCILELREVSSLEDDKIRADHFGTENYFVGELSRGGYLTCTMNRFSPQTGLAHFSVLKNRVAILKDDGSVNNFEMKRPLNAPAWVKYPTKSWKFHLEDPKAQFTTICISEKFTCAASYSMPSKKGEVLNLRQNEINIFVASPQGHRTTAKFPLNYGDNAYKSVTSMNPVHMLQYVEYSGVPLLICLQKFDYLHVLVLSKTKAPKSVHTKGPDGYSRAGVEYTGMIQLLATKIKKQQTITVAIVGPANYMLQLNIFTPKLDYKRFLRTV